MTSKRELQRRLAAADRKSNEYFYKSISSQQKATDLLGRIGTVESRLRFFEEVTEAQNTTLNADRRFKEDILLLEPQLKHYLTDGAWDFDRIRRAAEHLRGEDALASLGYTDQCVWPDNVTPLFPHDPSDGYGAA